MKTPAAKAKRLSSPRQLRALLLLQQGPRTVRDLAQQIGCNGVPQLIATLREKGLTIRVEWQEGRDRDSRKVKYGRYHLVQDSAHLADRLIDEFFSREGL